MYAHTSRFEVETFVCFLEITKYWNPHAISKQYYQISAEDLIPHLVAATVALLHETQIISDGSLPSLSFVVPSPSCCLPYLGAPVVPKMTVLPLLC